MVLVLGGSPEQDHRFADAFGQPTQQGLDPLPSLAYAGTVGQQFGPSLQDVMQIQAWLKQHGFTVGSVARAERTLDGVFRHGSTGRRNFQTSMQRYSLAGEMHIANSRDISIPEALWR